MERFAGFEDGALHARAERLRRAELDLDERVRDRVAQAQSQGRWVPTDPLYQRLSAVLKQVRSDLADTENERARRSKAAGAKVLTAT